MPRAVTSGTGLHYTHTDLLSLSTLYAIDSRSTAERESTQERHLALHYTIFAREWQQQQ